MLAIQMPGAIAIHIGIYCYRREALLKYAAAGPCEREQAESLEQLRVLWHGERIAVHVTASRPGPGVDTPEDLERVRALFVASNG
mgnify:CR=1 FL=1